MSIEKLFTNRFGTFLTTALFATGIILMVFGLSGSRPVGAADPVTIDWSDISPLISPDPDFEVNDSISPEVDTYFAGGANPHLNPYHGLGSSAGGLGGFTSQTFPNVGNTSVDITIYYSNNNFDGAVLEGPDLYQPGIDPNPDIRVTGDWVVRVNRDPIGTRTPTTLVISFSEPVYMDEYIVGSLSAVSGSYEHAIIRAFETADATGPVVKASSFINISNLTDCSTLLLDQCIATGPVFTNELSNIAVDPDLIDAGGDGVYDNVGGAADDGVYHVYGVITQPSGYGRAKLVYGDQAIQSIAASYFPTSILSANPFEDTDYTDQWISATAAPYTFTPFGPLAVTGMEASVSVQSTGLIVIGLVIVLVATTGSLALRRRRTLN